MCEVLLAMNTEIKTSERDACIPAETCKCFEESAAIITR